MLPIFLKFITIIITFIYVFSVHVCRCYSMNMEVRGWPGGQGNLFSPSLMWVPRIKLGMSRLVASAFCRIVLPTQREVWFSVLSIEPGTSGLDRYLPLSKLRPQSSVTKFWMIFMRTFTLGCYVVHLQSKDLYLCIFHLYGWIIFHYSDELWFSGPILYYCMLYCSQCCCCK